MKILMVGVARGKGSLAVRGVQLGGALGARVTEEPTAADWRWADLIVLIKRAWVPWLADAKSARVPIVWDALDCWRQPAENGVGAAQAKALFQRQRAQIKPALTICATEAQAEACDGVYLPHHSWPGLKPTPAREAVTTVGYEGNASYLGRWMAAVSVACGQRGWRFVINPPDLSACDILVAFRAGPWDGWQCREWKSGVKIVNAMAAGRPIISQDCAAVRELQPAGSTIETPDRLDQAFDEWEQHIWRASAVDQCLDQAPAFTLEAVAERYRQILQTVRQPCVA